MPSGWGIGRYVKSPCNVWLYNSNLQMPFPTNGRRGPLWAPLDPYGAALYGPGPNGLGPNGPVPYGPGLICTYKYILYKIIYIYMIYVCMCMYLPDFLQTASNKPRGIIVPQQGFKQACQFQTFQRFVL